MFCAQGDPNTLFALCYRRGNDGLDGEFTSGGGFRPHGLISGYEKGLDGGLAIAPSIRMAICAKEGNVFVQLLSGFVLGRQIMQGA